ncbi:hypothetical protein GX48_00775 [Paracoccidioides brasiliensis]|nr:hypothetical protein GX48_00775 [Paracoccidioides brasiliensis]
MPHGQTPIPPPRRQHDLSYVSGPPGIRPSPGYLHYHPPPHAAHTNHTNHTNGPPQPQPQPPPHSSYSAQQQFQHWYPYQQTPHPPPPHPQQFQPYAPLIVSSYPRSQQQPPPPALPGPPPLSGQTPSTAHQQPQQPPPTMLPHVPPQPSTASSTPLPSSFSTPTPTPFSAPSSTVTDNSHTNTPGNPSVVKSAQSVRANACSSISSSNSPAPQTPPAQQAIHTHERIKSATPLSRQLFQPPLPWLSVPETPFPAKAPRRRRKPRILQTSAIPVEFPTKPGDADAEPQERASPEELPKLASSKAEPETLANPQPSSQTGLNQPTTPSSTIASFQTLAKTKIQQTPTQPAIARQAVTPIVPVVPILFSSSPSTTKHPSTNPDKGTSETSKPHGSAPTTSSENQSQSTADIASSSVESTTATQECSTPAPPARPPPKSWADLVRTKAPASSADAVTTTAGIGCFGVSKGESLFDVINNIGSDPCQYGNKIAFIEPRGLVNTGNMCYMNSILQILVFCVPFYEFLDKISRRAVHSIKSELPLIDAMIMFMREFRVIDAATSAEKLRLRLKQNELEQYGESFIPEYVYQVIRHLPRFRDMRRGHQQDAQEFLGFLLEELHEECTQAVKQATSTGPDIPTPVDTDSASAASEPSVEGWLEVGHKQKPSITRSSGHVASESPITKIFGGKLRSEFRVPGNKNSVTLEPYQSLQLDIGSPQVTNIIDALKGLTKPETMQGDFNSSRGPKVTATKQVFIETLPPVLILHLKRFQYDSVTKGTQKIWKRVGYPLELEVPREVFPPHRRNNLLAAQGSGGGSGLPKYRLTGVIYHHGKNASGGHYTVDVRRQDGREWVRLDDTVIRRVRSEDVAVAGAGVGGEEDSRNLAAALEMQSRGGGVVAGVDRYGNIFERFGIDGVEGEEEGEVGESEVGWSQVNGNGAGNGVGSAGAGGYGYGSRRFGVNGSVSPAGREGESGKRTPSSRFAAAVGRRDSNKVAYLLFYQRIQGSV